MPYLYPESLVAGDTIGLVTPSSPMMPGRLEAGIAYLEEKGFKTKVGRHVHDANRFMAGSDEDRAQDIMDFFLDSSVKAIMATGGGYGSQRILPLLEYDLIRKNPKWVTGFSDDEWLNRISVPCIKEFPYGHSDRRCVLPIGKEVVLDSGIGMLSIL